jgi:tetratricopeptide (TPR) repeat protein
MEWSGVPLILIGIFCIIVLIGGCEAQYPTLRREGQLAMLDGQYGPARYLLLNADNKAHRKVETLHDLGVCSVMVAKQKFRERNQAAAFRELDNAVAYYRRAIDDVPGHQASLEGLNIALELKGQFEEALKHAFWTAEFVGPSAKQFVFLGNELEQRGDFDGAMLRFRQAVTMEPRSAQAHVAMAKFYIRHGQRDEAESNLVEASILDPRDPWVREQLAGRSRPAGTPESIVTTRSGSRP